MQIPFLGGSLSTPHAFSRFKIRPTVEMDVCIPSRSSSFHSFSLPIPGRASLSLRTASASSGLHWGLRTRFGRRSPSSKPINPLSSTRFPSTCVLGKCASDTALIVEAGGYRQLSLRKNLPHANAARYSTAAVVDEPHRSSQLGVFGKHSSLSWTDSPGNELGSPTIRIGASCLSYPDSRMAPIVFLRYCLTSI